MDALVLYDGFIIPINKLTNSEIFDPEDENLVFFHDDGRVAQFAQYDLLNNPTYYIALFSVKDNSFSGYFPTKSFYTYNTNVIKGQSGGTTPYALPGRYWVDLRYNDIKADTKVYFCTKHLTYTLGSNEEVKYTITYGYILNSLLGNLDDRTIEYATNTQQVVKAIPSQISNYIKFILEKKYYFNGQLFDFDNRKVQELMDVALVFKQLSENTAFQSLLVTLGLKNVFDRHLNLSQRFSSPNGNYDPSYHNFYKEDTFSEMRIPLFEFKVWLKGQEGEYSRITKESLLEWFYYIFPAHELAELSFLQKIDFLITYVNGNAWLSTAWFKKFNEELMVSKIIDSFYFLNNAVVDRSQIDALFAFLEAESPSSNQKSNYEIITDKVNDSLLFDDQGTGNRGVFVRTLYKLWLSSKFNIYHTNTTVADAALQEFSYDPKIDPIHIPYDSEKIGPWFADSFKFKFSKNKINVLRTEITYTGSSPTTGIPVKSSSDSIYGTYRIFQPILVFGIGQQDTACKVVLNSDGISDSIPIFYLKYIDDVGDYSDAKETFGLITDLALTFTGVGNLSKLKYFKHLSKLRKLGSLSPYAKVLPLEALQGVAALTEVTAGTLSIYTTYFDTLDPNSPEYAKHNILLFALELLSFSFEHSVQRRVQRNAQSIVDFSGGNLPAAMPSEVKRIISELTDIDGQLNILISLYPNIGTEIAGFSKTKKFDFLLDFKNREGDLDFIENNSALLDNWSSLYDIGSLDRRDLFFLNDLDLVNELVDYFTYPQLKAILEKVPVKQRIGLLRESISDSSLLAKFINNENGLDLFIQTLYPKVNALHVFQPADIAKVKQIISHNFPNKHYLTFLAKLNKYDDFGVVKVFFNDRVSIQNISKSRLAELFNNFPASVNTSVLQKLFQNTNQLYTKVKVYNNNTLIQTNNKTFISGKKGRHRAIFGPSNSTNPVNYPAGYYEPNNMDSYDLFSELAVINEKDTRLFDTEVKFWNDFFENQFSQGNHFEIEMESVRFACASCQRYILAALDVIKAEGKTVNLKFIGHKDAIKTSKIEEIINN